jgi:hypothetical protein
MATTKVLGQSYPTAATATTLYTGASASGTIVSSINVCNIGGSNDVIRIAIRPAGATLANQHYQVYGVTVPSSGVFTWTVGATLANTDVITIYSTAGTSAFSAFGQEL